MAEFHTSLNPDSYSLHMFRIEGIHIPVGKLISSLENTLRMAHELYTTTRNQN